MARGCRIRSTWRRRRPQAGISLGSDFQIKFQQIDNNSRADRRPRIRRNQHHGRRGGRRGLVSVYAVDGQTATIIAAKARVSSCMMRRRDCSQPTGDGRQQKVDDRGFRDHDIEWFTPDIYYIRAAGRRPWRLPTRLLRDAAFDAETAARVPFCRPREMASRGACSARWMRRAAGLSTVSTSSTSASMGLRGDFLQTRVATRPADFPNFLRLQNESAPYVQRPHGLHAHGYAAEPHVDGDGPAGVSAGRAAEHGASRLGGQRRGLDRPEPTRCTTRATRTCRTSPARSTWPTITGFRRRCSRARKNSSSTSRAIDDAAARPDLVGRGQWPRQNRHVSLG